MRKLVCITAGALAAATCLAGCEPMPFTLVPTASVQAKDPEPEEPAEKTRGSYLDKTSMKSDFDEGGGAVSEAVAWMERYTKEVERRTQVEKENRALAGRNQELSGQATKLQTDLKRAQQELDEANAMMLRLSADLKAWKKDVLGYREEMRGAQRQTAASLGRILQLLGGEVPSAPLAATPSAAPATPAGGAGKTPAAAKEQTHASTGS